MLEKACGFKSRSGHMALFTGKGDDGTTKTFGAKNRISKSSDVAEALGSLDEVNSFLGLCRSKVEENLKIGDQSIKEITHQIQRDLFIVQAEVAGAEKNIPRSKVDKMETLINSIEKELPPINSFFIPGANELSAMYDVARTLSRRAERRVITAVDSGEIEISGDTKAFLNRLSSLLYALARLVNYLSGTKEEAPTYE